MASEYGSATFNVSKSYQTYKNAKTFQCFYNNQPTFLCISQKGFYKN